MNRFEISYDFGDTNENVILDAINNLNMGRDTAIHISHNSGGNAQLAVDLSRAILSSSASRIEIFVTAYAASAAAFVVMSCQLYGSETITLTFNNACMIMYHRPRVYEESTGLAYFDLPSIICIEYDKLMHDWKNIYDVSYNDLKAYYSNHEYVFQLQ